VLEVEQQYGLVSPTPVRASIRQGPIEDAVQRLAVHFQWLLSWA
jgi:hypothetical protein